MEVLFPQYKSTTNNCKLVVDSYEDVETSFKGSKPKLPKKAHLLLTVDGKRTFEVTVSDVNYEVGTNITIPTKATVKFFTNPFESVLKINRSTPKEFEITYDLKSDGDCGYTLYNLVTLNHSEYENIQSLNDFKGVKGYFSHNDLKITYNADVASFNKLNKDEKLTDKQINDLIDCRVLYKNIKIADVEYESKDEKDPIYLIYKDGSKESAKDYVNDFEQRIKNVFRKYINEK